MEWYEFQGGNTKGTRGSEGGVTIEDMEYDGGARISLEKNTDIAPFAITFGIYGLMFHTHFESEKEKAMQYFELIKPKIEGVIAHLHSEGENKDWKDTYTRLINDLVS